jgi:hypothetical protein
MPAKNQKSRNTTTESVVTQPIAKPPIKNTISKAAAKKPSRAKLKETTEPNVTVTAIKAEEKTANKKRKHDKIKVIRDSFSFPEQDYLKISALKKTCLSEGIHVKKGELLRAGLHLLTKLDLAELKQIVEQVEKVKTGRPSSTKH